VARIPQVHRVGLALAASLVWNFILLISINPHRDQSSKIDRIFNTLDILGNLSYRITQNIAPGHSWPQIVLMIVASIVLYAVLAWAVLTAVPRLWDGWPRPKSPKTS
jgi:hypothetical protein